MPRSAPIPSASPALSRRFTPPSTPKIATGFPATPSGAHRWSHALAIRFLEWAANDPPDRHATNNRHVNVPLGIFPSPTKPYRWPAPLLPRVHSQDCRKSSPFRNPSSAVFPMRPNEDSLGSAFVLESVAQRLERGHSFS